MLRPLIVVAGIAWCVPLALAQPEPAPAAKAGVIEPAAQEFIDRFRAEVGHLKDLSCLVEQKLTEGGETTTSIGAFTGTFERPASGGAELTGFRVERKGEGGMIIQAFDGKTATLLDHGKRTFASMDAKQAYPTRDNAAVVPMWCLSDILMSKGARIVAARMLPDAESDGVRCAVVEYTVEVPGGPAQEDAKDPLRLVLRQVRHVGKDDLLPRRIESWTS